jgi:hypothetical protein
VWFVTHASTCFLGNKNKLNFVPVAPPKPVFTLQRRIQKRLKWRLLTVDSWFELGTCMR